MTQAPPYPFIETLQNLRLLPPPCNELVPLLTTIAVFSVMSLLVEDLPHRWTALLQKSSYSIEQWFVYGSFAIYMGLYWGYSLFVHSIEHLPFFGSLLSHFKIQPRAPIASLAEVGKMVPVVLFNQIVFAIPMLKMMFMMMGDWRDVDFLAVPSIPRLVGTLLLNVLCTELWFYTVHRCLHTPWLYKNVHYLHHKYKAPSCLESVYVHPLEYAVNSFAVLLAGPLVTAPSLMVFYMWIALVTFLQVHDHSGYWLPFLPRVLMHDYHHQRIQCCYGILGLLDGIFQTENQLQQFVKDHEKSNPCYSVNNKSGKKE